METELREMGLTWSEAGKVGKDRDRWRRIVAALCFTRGEEDELINLISSNLRYIMDWPAGSNC